MTEALRSWVAEQFKGNPPMPHWRASALDSSAAEFWLRAFCDEVKRRSLLNCRKHLYRLEREGDAFDDLKRELLG